MWMFILRDNQFFGNRTKEQYIELTAEEQRVFFRCQLYKGVLLGREIKKPPQQVVLLRRLKLYANLRDNNLLII